jgi:hypothetical protein
MGNILTTIFSNNDYLYISKEEYLLYKKEIFESFESFELIVKLLLPEDVKYPYEIIFPGVLTNQEIEYIQKNYSRPEYITLSTYFTFENRKLIVTVHKNKINTISKEDYSLYKKDLLKSFESFQSIINLLLPEEVEYPYEIILPSSITKEERHQLHKYSKKDFITMKSFLNFNNRKMKITIHKELN